MTEMIEGAPSTGPILRYPGSKHSLAARIVEMMPEHRHYVEPYAGSAAVLMAKPRSSAETLNDRNDEVVNLFGVVEDPALRARLVELVSLTPYAESWLRFVLSAPPAEDAVERARRYLVRSWFDLGGLRPRDSACLRRAGRKTSRARPASVWAGLPERIALVGPRLEGVEILDRDAVEIVRDHDDPGVLVYADPPYLHETRGMTRYYRHEMSIGDHERLLDALIRHRGPALISGYDSALYRSVLEEGAGWKRREFPGRSQDARPGDTRKEIVWANPTALAACEGARPAVRGRVGAASRKTARLFLSAKLASREQKRPESGVARVRHRTPIFTSP